MEPGLAFASATSSLKSLAGIDACRTRNSAVLPIRLTGARSFSGS